VSTKDNLGVTRKMKCEIFVQSHHTTIRPGYECHMHVDNVNQTVKLLRILRTKKASDTEWQDIPEGDSVILRSGIRAEVIFYFKHQPEHVKTGTRFLAREGMTMAFGTIVELL